MIQRVKCYMRTKVRSLLQHGLSSALLLTNRTTSVTVLMYHEVLEDEHDVDAWTVVRASEFRKQMEYMKSHYDVISLDAACGVIRDGGQLNSKYAVVTFDDGYSGNHRVVLPVMAALDLPFTVFCATKPIEQREMYWWDKIICSAMACKRKLMLRDMLLGTYDFSTGVIGESRWNEMHRLLTDLKNVERKRREHIVRAIASQIDEAQQPCLLQPMTPDQVRELADTGLATIGAHSHTHDILTQLTPVEARENILRSKEYLEAWTGRRIDYFSYPNGDYSRALMRAVERVGFQAAVSTDERAWRRTDDIYAIPRIGIGRFDSMSIFKAKVSRKN